MKLPIDLNKAYEKLPDPNNKLVVDTASEPLPFTSKCLLYAAIGLSVPFLLWQIWAFVSPGLYPHERKYVTPFIGLSSIFFVLGAATAYYLIFPPAAKYLLGLGSDFRLLLKADDYFDFIILLMLGMGAGRADAGDHLCAGADGPGDGALDAEGLARSDYRHSDCGGRAVADQRRAQHAAVCGADVCALRDFDHCGVDLRAEADRRLKRHEVSTDCVSGWI